MKGVNVHLLKTSLIREKFFFFFFFFNIFLKKRFPILLKNNVPSFVLKGKMSPVFFFFFFFFFFSLFVWEVINTNLLVFFYNAIEFSLNSILVFQSVSNCQIYPNIYFFSFFLFAIFFVLFLNGRLVFKNMGGVNRFFFFIIFFFIIPIQLPIEG